ncbi:MAG: metallopeptidase family protein [Syntrophales bacterium]|nr:metallopeptidase family protein [Syntrophales bacterium]MDD5233700.1 metallopeptidase family protein [Syntrophales bacterium]MDD5532911.1 metallopeptidase family protein [Syntrophales bacterium]HPL63546.1 metallopeptidase family protein [Syntrophales bacterium]
MRLTRREFDKVVERAIRRIPPQIRAHLENIIITVQERPSSELLEEMGLPPDYPLLGAYQGTSLMERSAVAPPVYPDMILIFQQPLQEMCRTVRQLEREIEITVVHEVAHFVGMTEEELIELGYE